MVQCGEHLLVHKCKVISWLTTIEIQTQPPLVEDGSTQLSPSKVTAQLVLTAPQVVVEAEIFPRILHCLKERHGARSIHCAWIWLWLQSGTPHGLLT